MLAGLHRARNGGVMATASVIAVLALLFSPVFVSAQSRDDCEKLLLSPKQEISVILRKTGHETLAPKVPDDQTPIREIKPFDVIVIGGGPAGLTSAVYLTDAGKRVLVIEREDSLGGLAAGSSLNGIESGGGAAYSAGPDGLKQYKIFQHIGLGDYKKRLSIHEPIDSYLWNGRMYHGIWEDKTLLELPASFALFKHMLMRADREEISKRGSAAGILADRLSMAEFVRQMPLWASELKDRKSRAVYERFLNDSKVNRADPMRDVLDLLDLYGRSALGGTTNEISARQFIDFYVSELTTRYTGTLGTGAITESLLKTLKKGKRNIEFRTSSPVASVENIKGGVEVTYIHNSKTYVARAAKAIFAAPITLAPKLIKGLTTYAPAKAKAISEIKMTDYAVMVLRLKGHPFRETYDLWIRAPDYSRDDPTDIILGRWMDPKINGYNGMRKFENNPDDDDGILTIYHPLHLSKNQTFTKEQSLALAKRSITRVREILGPYLETNGQKIDIQLVEMFRWPDSIHRVEPGYLAKEEILREPVGNIEFANNTLSAPELESAMEAGFDAAKTVISDLNNLNSSVAPARHQKR